MDNQQSPNSESAKKEQSTWDVIKGLIIISISIFLIIDYFNEWENTFKIKNKFFPNKEESVDDMLNNLKSKGVYSNSTQEERLNQLINAVDLKNKTTNDYAARLASLFPGEYNIGQICSIYEYIQSNWKYVSDGRAHENFRSASRTINNNLAGDCDDFAILLSAAIESIGGKTRISLAFDEESGHAFTEVLIASNELELQNVANYISEIYNNKITTIHYTRDKQGYYWLNLDWFGNPPQPGGEYYRYLRREVYYINSKNPHYETEEKKI